MACDALTGYQMVGVGIVYDEAHHLLRTAAGWHPDDATSVVKVNGAMIYDGPTCDCLAYLERIEGREGHDMLYVP